MDPITMSLLAAQGIAGLGKTGYGLYQQNAGRAGLAGVQEASRMKPAEYAEMLKQAKSGQAVQQRIGEINKALSTSTEALQQSGSRAVIGGIGKIVEAGTKANNQLLGQQQKDIMSALGASAMGSERKIGRDTQREMIEKRGFQNAINAGVQNTVAGLSDIGRTIGYGASMRNETDVENPLNTEARAENLTKQMQSDLFKDQFNQDGLMFNQQSPADSGMSAKEFKKLLEGFDGELSLNGLEELEDIQNMEQGGAVKTPGEFSHDTNPIHMIQDGEVIGEMTGGEYVLNPKQAKAISKESKFFRNLLKTKRFK
jgi:hypothetical protein